MVYDFEGALEAIGEVSDSITRPSTSSSQRESRKASRGNGGVDKNSRDIGERMEVGDSEDEALDDETPLTTSPQREPSKDKSHERKHSTPVNEKSQSLIMMPSFHTLINPITSQNKVRGDALLSHFLRRLRSLTTHATIFIGDEAIRLSAHPRRHLQQTSGRREGESPSAFDACSVRPSLGNVMGRGVDLSLLFWRWRDRGEEGRWIVEVLSDREGGRVGRWDVFRL